MLNQDFKEFVQFLNDNDVHYLVIGGYAVAFHGYPRYTKDIDIWIRAEPGNARRMLMALQQFGFGSLGLKEEDFLEPNQVVQLGYPPNRIDILTSLSGVDFDECFARKVTTEIGGQKIHFIDIDNLKINKRASGRLQDLADVENLSR